MPTVLAAQAGWFLENVWIIPALPALSFVGILLFGKRMPRRGSELGIAAVALAFVLSLGVTVQWIDRSENPPSVDHGAGAVTDHTGTDGSEAPVEDHGPGEADEAGGHAAPATDTVTLAAVETGTEGGEESGEGHHAAAEPVVNQIDWLTSGGAVFGVGTFVDGLSVMMLFVVTLVSLLVHVYSTDYVAGDRRYTHFFAFLSLFTASMLFLVLTTNTLQLIVGWELVGLCSFVLIGHWWEEKANSDAALKAFLTNRVGDVGLLVGVSILFAAAGGTFDIVDINAAALGGDISHGVLLVASLALTLAVMSKSGQFFLHTWLPDAMAGPTPVSALIHAATMVVAGVFMVARLYGVFWEGYSIGDANINVLAMVGGITTVVGASLAFVQRDIKKVLAYSTISQLGYMVLALGVGAWTAAVFHLFTHAFFKACLFLGSGSVSHAVHSFDMVSDMGGLRRHMPRTYATFLIATLALAGAPLLAGFWSKDEILAGALQLGGGGEGYPIPFALGLLTAGLTAAYMTRCVYLTFHGTYRGHADPHHLHESGPRITVPLMILAFLSVTAGWVNLPADLVPDSIALRFERYVQPTGAVYFPGPEHGFALPHFSWGLAIGSTAVAAVFFGVAWLWWFKGRLPHGLTERFALARAGYVLLENKYYLDHLYTGIIAGGIKGPVARGAYWINQNVIDAVVNGAGIAAVRSARFVYDRIDQGAVDAVVNGSGSLASRLGRLLRGIQTGRVQDYAALLFGAAAVGAGVFVIVFGS